MFEHTSGVTRPAQRQSAASRALRLLLTCLTLWSLIMAGAAHAQADNPSGLPLPRFASTRSDPINVRVGPGTKYEIAWTYLKPGVPVEIVQEFDTWRKNSRCRRRRGLGASEPAGRHPHRLCHPGNGQ